MDSVSIFASTFPLASLSEGERQALAAVKPELATEFTRYIYRESKNNPFAGDLLMTLLRRADESGLSVSDWISDAVIVYRWLERNKQTASLSDTLEYVSCALEGSALQMGHSVEWYLECHGFASARPLE